MKKSIFFLTFLINAGLYSQSAIVTPIEKGPEKIKILPGINSATNPSVSPNLCVYNLEFDMNGSFISNINSCFDIADIGLQKGFLELRSTGKGKNEISDWYYVPYDQSEEVSKLAIKDAKGTEMDMKHFRIIAQHFRSDYFIGVSEGTYYRVSENFEITHSYKPDAVDQSNTREREVLGDGCLYYLFADETGFRIEKLDVINQKRLAINFDIPKGLDFLPAFYRYYYIIASPESYYLSINNDGSKVFFGFFAGKKKYGYQVDDPAYLQAKKGFFYIINGSDFSIESKHEFEFAEEHLAMFKKAEDGLKNPYIEDVCFFNNEVYIVVTNPTFEGTDPQAIYKISLAKKEFSLHGVISNEFEDLLASKRGHAKIFISNNKMQLIYQIQYEYGAGRNVFAKPPSAIRLVDITQPTFSSTMIMEGLKDYKLKINMVSGTRLADGNLLFLSSILGGTSIYEKYCAVKLILN